jgi:ankyrin repeat protein
VVLLIEAKADVNQGTTSDGTTPLSMAAQNGHADVVSSPLSIFIIAVSILDRYKHLTYLDLPCLYLMHLDPHYQVVLLIEAKADVSQAKTSDGSTPLLLAAQGGHADCLTLLLLADASANQAMVNGVTPLMCAAWAGYLECVVQLLKHGADSDTEATGVNTVLGAKVGSTAGGLAAQHGHTAIVDALHLGGSAMKISSRR